MAEDILLSLMAYNNWANKRLIETCAALEAAQLDAQPKSATAGTIRETLVHLVSSQRGYLALLTLPVEARKRASPDFENLPQAAAESGAALLEIAKTADGVFPRQQLRTTDGYHVEAWVVIVQAIQHAIEHREQVSSMLTALGITPPELDGWAYGEIEGALVLASEGK